ncbi:branched-chain alpha-keto acid dehydrogenase E1-alpha subunit [Mycena vulgaris]|nr:branched-chain alpha-keto acid dehydrogenase E1-alpha subunit [Mycena vulgaris]
MLRSLATRTRGIHLGQLPNSGSPIVSTLSFFNSVTPPGEKIPTFRVLDGLGKPVDGAELPDIDEPFARKLYENMQLLPTLDTVLYNVQRQGKISFHMTSHGEEATIIGCAAALEPDDEVLGQYREMGVLLWRGFGVDAVMAQCFGTHEDTSGKGRQMPVHFGSPAHHFHTISSPLATQIPQAAGVGYALRRARPRSIAACFFGEGAASEGDFHAGLLLASTLPAPTLFLARNNGFAISTPSTEQFFGDGIAARGPGYGIDTVRVDGNDVLAVLAAVREARKRTQEQGRAVLVEAMSYRVGHHSTSDDSFAYRARAEVEDRKRIDNPLARFRLFLEARGWWTPDDEGALKERLQAQVLAAFRHAEAAPKGAVGELFTDVYGGEEPWNITEQRKELAGLLRKYGGTWEPWRNELARFKDKGEDLTKGDV